MRGQATVAERTEPTRPSTAEFWDARAARAAEAECGCTETCPIDHDDA
jgi:hypothetical protein